MTVVRLSALVRLECVDPTACSVLDHIDRAPASPDVVSPHDHGDVKFWIAAVANGVGAAIAELAPAQRSPTIAG